MKKSLLFVLCFGVIAASGCSEDSSSSGNDTGCEASCVSCVEGVCQDSQDEPGKSEDDKDDPGTGGGNDDPGAGSGNDDPGTGGGTDDPAKGCDACAKDQSCVDDQCVACVNTVCDGVCCEEDEVCDLYTKACAMADPMTGNAPCDGFYCFEGQVCSEDGVCAQMCNDGRVACAGVCCGEGTACYDLTYCRVVCSDEETMCGKAGNEVCCEAGDVCENDMCLIACPAETGIRCGTNLELCCDAASEVCAFNKCVKPTSRPEGGCKSDNDCDFWSMCDLASGACVGVDEDDDACIYNPPKGEFAPVVKWHQEDNIEATPIVINLTDDNGDGKIDTNDIPEIVVVNVSGMLTAYDGKTGEIKAQSAKDKYNRCDDLAAADIDNDGVTEVLVPTLGTNASQLGLRALTLVKADDGTWSWNEKYFIKATNPIKQSSSSSYGIDLHPTVADLDSDGVPDIVTTSGVINGKNWESFACSLNFKGTVWSYYDLFAVADLDQDGNMEIIGTDIYDNQCQVIVNHALASQSFDQSGNAKNTSYWYSAVADLVPDDNDPNYPGELVPEIVRVRSGYVSVWKVYKNTAEDGSVTWSQRLVWEQAQTSSSGGGNPVIADFDGDKQPDIGVAGRTHYSVFNGQTGEIVWASKTQDATSEKTGSSVFDFEGDGVAEVVYRDEVYLRIYAGPGAGYDESGKKIDKDGDGYMDADVLWSVQKTSGTIVEYPIIADVDNDGRTEIVIVSNKKDWTPSGLPLGLTVYSDSNDNWVRTRRIWNQHSYHVTNINEDGTVPIHEEANWLNPHLNNYRANVQPTVNLAPDFVPDKGTYSHELCVPTDAINSPIILNAPIFNRGSRGTSADIAASFYIKDYELEDGTKTDLYLGTKVVSEPVVVGGSVMASFEWDRSGSYMKDDVAVTIKPIDPTGLSFMYKVDEANGDASYIKFNECREQNNDSEIFVVENCPTIIL